MRLKPLAAAFLCFLAVRAVAQESYRFAGSTTVAGALIPKLGQLEQAVGRKVELNANSSTQGLAAILAGTADFAMISDTLDDVAKVLNARSPGAVKVGDFRSAPIGEVRLLCIAHPRNAVKSLTHAQLVGVFTGKIKNWKELGGADAPIVVLSVANATSMVQDKLLDGKPVTASARIVPTATQIPTVVGAEPNAIGIISASHAHRDVAVVQTETLASIPLFLVTKGEPRPDQAKTIAAARKLLAN